jgi:glycosyltransferase involved in cell wall biosynthesis
MRVIFIGSDKRIFLKNSEVLERMKKYAKTFDFMASIVFSVKRENLSEKKIAQNAIAKPTKAPLKILAPLYASFIAMSLIYKDKNNKYVISAQDPFESGLAGFLAAKITGAKLQVQVHTDLFNPNFSRNSLKNRIRLFLAKRLIKWADGVRVVSERIKESIMESGIKTKKEIGVLPIFSDMKTRYAKAPAIDWRTIFPHADFVFATVNRLEKEKNTALIIEAFAEFSKRFDKAVLVIAGSGSEEEALRWLAKGCDIEDKVYFAGYVNNSFSILKSANAFLQASYYEGYGMSLAEAVYCGLPFVSTDVGDASKFIEKGARGELCREQNKYDFCKAMESIYKERMRYTPPKDLFLSQAAYLRKYKELLELCL